MRSDQELLAIAKQNGITLKNIDSIGRQPQPQANPAQNQAQPNVQSLLEQLKVSGLIKPKNNILNTIGQSLGAYATGKPVNIQDQDSDLEKLLMQEAVKSQFEDPTVRQLREAEINSLSQPPPSGFKRIGKQIVVDPEYIDPKEQIQIDKYKEEQQQAEEAKLSKANLAKMQAQDIYNTVSEIEKGVFSQPKRNARTIIRMKGQ